MSLTIIVHAVLVLFFRLSLTVVNFGSFTIENESEAEPKELIEPGMLQKLLRRYVPFFWSFWMFQALAVTFPDVVLKLPAAFLVPEVFNIPFREFAGLSLMLIGLIYYAWTFITFKNYLKSNTEALLSKGPYRQVRHPLYSGTILILMGSLFCLPTPVLLGSTLFCFLAFHLEAKTEELEMEAHFGSMYLEYKKRTKKLVPFVY